MNRRNEDRVAEKRSHEDRSWHYSNALVGTTVAEWGSTYEHDTLVEGAWQRMKSYVLGMAGSQGTVAEAQREHGVDGTGHEREQCG